MTKRQLRKLMEENNAKSPDVITAVVFCESRTECYGLAGIYIDIYPDQPDWLKDIDTWQKTILKMPVELYFPFKRKKDLMRFVKEVRREFPTIHMDI